MKSKTILVIQKNIDSDSSLVQHLHSSDVEIEVRGVDNCSVESVKKLSPEKIIISHCEYETHSFEMIGNIVSAFHLQIPMLGICQGNLVIGSNFGAEITGSKEGGTAHNTQVHHDGSLLFRGMFSSFAAEKYLAKTLDKRSIPENLRITAWTEDGIVMGIQVIDSLTFGIQFFPESDFTPGGITVLNNFLDSKCSYDS